LRYLVTDRMSVRFVDYDPGAANAAARACRDAADDLRDAADLLDGPLGAHLGAWSGASRIEFDGAAADIAADLRAEATALEATADDIDAATSSARSAETSRRRAHEAEQERLRREREALPRGVR
jgi:uncharacterized protein YukE